MSGDDAGVASGSAYIYLFDPDTFTWVERAKLTASDAESDDQLGASVSVGGDIVLVGAPGDDDMGAQSGSVYVFDFGILEAIDLLLALIDAVIDLNLQQGIENGLVAMLDLALQAAVDLNNNNDAAVCATLSAFISAVEAQSGNMVSAEDAAALIAAAQEILDLLQCDELPGWQSPSAGCCTASAIDERVHFQPNGKYPGDGTAASMPIIASDTPER